HLLGCLSRLQGHHLRSVPQSPGGSEQRDVRSSATLVRTLPASRSRISLAKFGGVPWNAFLDRSAEARFPTVLRDTLEAMKSSPPIYTIPACPDKQKRRSRNKNEPRWFTTIHACPSFLFSNGCRYRSSVGLCGW